LGYEEFLLEHSKQIMRIADILEDLTLGCKDMNQRLEVLEKKIEGLDKAGEKQATE
jgi:hypothetical protein